jgi:hypothetical protein
MSSLFTRHAIFLQTAFSELKRQAHEQRDVLIGSPGSVGIRRVKDSEFYYRQYYDARGRKAAQYIGPVKDPAAEARARSIRERIDAVASFARDARALAQHGYVRVDGRVAAVVASFANSGLFRAGAVLVGSHAYGALLNEIGVRAASYATEDVDLARGQRLATDAMARGRLDFAEVLRESTLDLVPIPGFGRAPSTSYKVPGAPLRVDLLAPAGGAEVTVKVVPELMAHATALPHLRALLDDPIETAVLTREGAVAVRVPRPEAFVWHKMQLPVLRSDRDKTRKDVTQAAVVFAVLAEDAADALEASLGSLSPAARKRIVAGARQVRRLLTDGPHERARELLEKLVPAVANE